MIHSLKNKSVTFRGTSHFVAHNATVIGSVIIENNASIWFNAVIRGDNDTVSIGEGTNLQEGVIIHTDEGIPVSLGKHITIGHGAVIHGCTHEPFSAHCV